MKRVLLLAALVAAASFSTADAQIHFGLKAGLNTASLSFDDDTEEGIDALGIDKLARLGFTGGVFAEFDLSPSLAVRPEVLYSQKGVRLEGNLLASDVEATVKLDYLDVPVLLLYRIPTGSALEVGVLAGPYAAFELSESLTTEGSFGEGESDTEAEDTEVFTSTDFGAVAGVTVGAGAFAVDLRYGLGLTNLVEDESSDPDIELEPGSSAKHRVFSVTGSWTFGR